MKILIADDQLSIHKFLDKMMDWSLLGVTEVHHAFDGQEAVDKLRQISPDLLILDIKMPFLDGIGVLKCLGLLPRKPKIIILSAYEEFAYAREAMKFGVQHYLLKPIDVAVFTRSVEMLVVEIKQETKASLESLLYKACRLNSMDPDMVQVIRDDFDRLGISRYVSAYINIQEQDNEGIPEPFQTEAGTFLIQINKSDLYILHGLTKGQDLQDIYRYYQEYRLRSAVIGFSMAENHTENLLANFMQCRIAAQMGFYNSDKVLQYGRAVNALEFDPFDQNLVNKYESDFMEMLERGYSETAYQKTIDALFQLFRTHKVDPDIVYQICHRVLFMMCKKLPLSGLKLSIEHLRAYRHIEQLQSAFAEIVRLLSRKRDVHHPTAAEMICNIKCYVDSCYNGDVSLDTISSKFILNKYQLCRLFKSELGVSYWSYVTQVRMRKAAELLLYTHHKISSIALDVGYPEESHFSTAFKKYYGMSPKDYKRINKQDSVTFSQ